VTQGVGRIPAVTATHRSAHFEHGSLRGGQEIQRRRPIEWGLSEHRDRAGASPPWRRRLLFDPARELGPMLVAEVTDLPIVGLGERRHPGLAQTGDDGNRWPSEATLGEFSGRPILEDAEPECY
jgi:hypothetical protein